MTRTHDLHGRSFYKMSGSGNDFLVFDVRDAGAKELDRPEVIRELCARGTGVGADGLVILQKSGPGGGLRIRYYNADGSLGELCGNASLCCTALASRLGIAGSGDLSLASDAGELRCRMAAGQPEIDLQVVHEVVAEFGVEKSAGERRIGFARVGVPHLVVRVDSIEKVDMVARAPSLRHHSSLPHGANVNFLSLEDGRWRVRTFERGVEGETLACGSGAVACAVLLAVWGEHMERLDLLTRSGKTLSVTLERLADGWKPSLRGEGRLVYAGTLEEAS